MRIWTAHVRPDTAPVLVREGFSWAALLFGPLWLLLHRAWLAALLAMAAGILVGFAPGPWGGLLEAAVAVGLGLFGRDLWRWSLDRRGFLLVDLLAAPDEDTAMARLLERRPDLMQAAFVEAMR